MIDRACRTFGQRGRKTWKNRDLRRGSRSERRQSPGHTNLINGVHAVAATPFADIESLVENRFASKVVILARVIGCIAVLGY